MARSIWDANKHSSFKNVASNHAETGKVGQERDTALRVKQDGVYFLPEVVPRMYPTLLTLATVASAEA
jgi:hypothetical protein